MFLSYIDTFNIYDNVNRSCEITYRCTKNYGMKSQAEFKPGPTQKQRE